MRTSYKGRKKMAQIKIKPKPTTTTTTARSSAKRTHDWQPTSLTRFLARSLLLIVASSITFSQLMTPQQSHLVEATFATNTAAQYFAPKLIHQPQSVVVEPNKFHHVECPIEANPAPEVKWFKDDQLLVSQPTHLEQTGAELMFFQVNDDDSGQYHCEATNYLGTVSTEPFKLTVKSSVYDPRVRLETRAAEVGVDQQAEFTCSFPQTASSKATTTLRQQRKTPDVAWRRNGRRLPVRWLSSTDQDSTEVAQSFAELRTRYTAHQLSNGQANADVAMFTLTIMKTQLKDDNATFSCLVGASLIDGLDAEPLARESNQVKLRVYPERSVFNLDATNLAPPIADLPLLKDPQQVNQQSQDGGQTRQQDKTTSEEVSFVRQQQNNFTTQLDQLAPTRRVSSLRETLQDLYELSKPTLVGFGVLLLISLIILVQWAYTKRKNRLENRYIKHHAYSSSSGSGTSGASSAINAAIDCADPLLKSLMSRNLSAQSAMSLSANSGQSNGGAKKFRSYRDQLRKVAAVNDSVQGDIVVGSDLIDAGYFGGQQLHNCNQQQSGTNNSSNIDNEPFFVATALPNLYNQSVAAREQARSLLQSTNEHMRSLGNLQVGQQKQHKLPLHHQVGSAALHRFNGQTNHQNGSHLNLPLSFTFNDTDATNQTTAIATNTRNNAEQPSQLIASALWQPQINQQFNQARQHKFNHANKVYTGQQINENYQLVNCSSISPSSSSSSSAGSSTNNNATQCRAIDLNQMRQFQPQTGQLDNHVEESNPSLNHYSTIDINDEDDDRYEEVDGARQNLQPSRRSSAHLKLMSSQGSNQDSFRAAKTSTFVRNNSNLDSNQLDLINQNKSLRSSLISNSNSSTSGCADLNTTNSTISSSAEVSSSVNKQFGNQRRGNGNNNRLHQSKKATNNLKVDNNNKRQSQFLDQLSPYAVSSIGSMATNLQPPPVTSEAMRALNEQFDINQLLLDESSERNSSPPSPFDALPPPPPSSNN